MLLIFSLSLVKDSHSKHYKRLITEKKWTTNNIIFSPTHTYFTVLIFSISKKDFLQILNAIRDIKAQHGFLITVTVPVEFKLLQIIRYHIAELRGATAGYSITLKTGRY